MSQKSFKLKSSPFYFQNLPFLHYALRQACQLDVCTNSTQGEKTLNLVHKNQNSEIFSKKLD